MQVSRVIEGKKYMWDGVERESEEEAGAVLEKYRAEGFEATTIREGGRSYVFTRRVVTDVKVEGGPGT